MPTQGHPNATASLFTTGLAYAVYRVSLHYEWLRMSSATSLLVAGAIITAVLYIGRRGVWPMLKSIWTGAAQTVAGEKTVQPQEPPAVQE
jgi:hypothetical protein